MKIVFKKDSDILNQCRKYDISLWEHPQFLFMIMGVVIILSIITTYWVGTAYLVNPETIIMIVFSITTILLIISFIISQSFEKLAEANKVKSELIGITSHQLRTPLANLKWIYDALAYNNKNLTKNQLDNFLMMRENIDRMIKMTDNLLTVSRIEKKKLFILRENINFEETIRQTIEKERPFFNDFNNIEISFHTDKEKIPLVYTDPQQIEWIVKNLFSNDVKYSSCNKNKIKIGITIKKNGDNEVFFEIKDNGIGIHKEDQKYIFEKFSRGKGAFKYNIQGTGLGLFACKSIIEKLGGKIGFESKEKIGSKFWFILPIK